MFKHILVATDGSALSLKAAKTAVRLAASLGSRLTGVYVIPKYMPLIYGEAVMYLPEMSPITFKKAAGKEADAALAVMTKLAAAAGITCVSLKVTNAHPWSAIISVARGKKCDLIVMASHGRGGLAGFLLGSETTKVLTHSKVPVLVCR